MLKGLIRNIRQKPKSARDGIAFGTAAVFSFLVFSVWAFNMPSRMAAIEESYAEKPEEGSGIGSFFSGVREQFASAIESIDIPTSTAEQVEEGSSSQASTIVMPNVEETKEALIRGNSTTSDKRFSEIEASEEGSTGREVRIITTQSSSSASSTTP